MPARLIVGGGIGAGKSTAVDVFQSLGAFVIRSDEVAREVLAPGEPLVAVVADRWPESVVDGAVRRDVLGRIVFQDSEQLAELEAITHPETSRRLRALAEAHSERDLVVEMPIIRDWLEGWLRVVVDAPRQLRLERAIARDDLMTREDIEDVMDRQVSREEWLLVADYVVDNSAGLDRLERECRLVWDEVTAD